MYLNREPINDTVHTQLLHVHFVELIAPSFNTTLAMEKPDGPTTTRPLGQIERLQRPGKWPGTVQCFSFFEDCHQERWVAPAQLGTYRFGLHDRFLPRV